MEENEIIKELAGEVFDEEHSMFHKIRLVKKLLTAKGIETRFTEEKLNEIYVEFGRVALELLDIADTL